MHSAEKWTVYRTNKGKLNIWKRDAVEGFKVPYVAQIRALKLNRNRKSEADIKIAEGKRLNC